jgi:predicted metal-dependent phosphoesterase TrpH
MTGPERTGLETSLADLHVHTLASDGTAGVAEILGAGVAAGLAVMAITDHDRIDAAQAGAALAGNNGLPIEVIVGEEISTRGGHLLGLWLSEPIRPWQSLRSAIIAVHEQGGLAIPAHPLFPYPLCAQAATLRRLIADPDPRCHPDAIEVFNPTTFGRPVHRRVVRFAAAHGLAAVGSSDAHALEAIGQGTTAFPGRSAEDLRRAILAGETSWQGTFHATAGQLGTFGRQLRKYGRDIRDETRGRVRHDGTGRDHGYPGGRSRPPRFQPDSDAQPAARDRSGR